VSESNPLTGAPHEADFPFGNRWCQMVLAKFWQSQLGDPYLKVVRDVFPITADS